MTDNQEIVRRLGDLDYLAQKRQMICYSDFLNMDEYSSYLMQRQSYTCDTVPFSEIADMERQMIAFIPDALCFNEIQYPITYLKINVKNKKFAQSFSHRDVLGVLMNMGIDRKLIGDIFISDTEACFLANSRIKDFLLEEFHQIKRTDVYLEEVEGLPTCFKPKFETFKCSVASLRLDCIVAEFAKCSRSGAERFVKQGQVYVNSKQILQGSYNCKVNDKVSVRGVGKMIFHDIIGTSKKDKIVIEIRKYC